MVILQLDPHKPDEQPSNSGPRSFSMMERFWSFLIAGAIVGVMISYYEESYTAYFIVQIACMLTYCALCLAKIVEEMCE